MQDDVTLPSGAVRVPLYRRDGSIRAYAIVDASDAEWVNQWRWRLSGGYAARTARIAGRWSLIQLHRVLLGLEHGDPCYGDHQNLDRLDNRRSNLRAVSQQGNSQNRASHRGSSSKYRGVCWSKAEGKWFARVWVGGKQVSLGLFSDEDEAGEAARIARLKDMPYALN